MTYSILFLSTVFYIIPIYWDDLFYILPIYIGVIRGMVYRKISAYRYVGWRSYSTLLWELSLALFL